MVTVESLSTSGHRNYPSLPPQIKEIGYIFYERYWVSDSIHRPGIKKQTKEKYDVSETGSVSVLR
jgi:hypothetical protein